MPRVPAEELAVLRRWASGDFYPLSTDQHGRDALDDLADDMATRPDQWWRAFRKLIAELDKAGVQNLGLPFGALLRVGGRHMWDQVAGVARTDRRVANAFWDAMYFSQLADEAYERLGRQMTLEAFVRHEPRIPVRPGQPWPDEWEDEWSGDVLSHLNNNNPDEAWALCLELLAISADPQWSATIGAFIVEDLLHEHGDAFIDRIESEAVHNERLKMALPTARWMVPDHLIDRVRAAAGRYWDEKA